MIFGGAYQGKVDFAKDKFSISDSDIYVCPLDKSDIFNDNSFRSAKAVCHLERLILTLTKEQQEAKEVFIRYNNLLQNKILILDDISQGIVPMDPILRQWREATGRAMLYLSKEAKEVYRVFCGIGEKLK
jgi:adenosyl cobinamide kinase/adenosyl cobinamide phosphate guanylyltransferase